MNKIFKLFLTAMLAFALVCPVFAQEADEPEEEIPFEELSTDEKINVLKERLDGLNNKIGGFKLSGEAKSGLYWRSAQNDGMEVDEFIGLHSMDDAGGNHILMTPTGETTRGRFRLNIDYETPTIKSMNFGFKTRITWQNFTEYTPDVWTWAFAYGNFFNNQLVVSVGKLGGSPWGAGGPEIWTELENFDKAIGMRVEYKPSWIPKKVGEFDIGFVFNYFNADMDQGWDADTKIDLTMLLQESVFGISYTHKYAHARFAYKLDSSYDAKTAIGKTEGGTGEDEFIYRLEERILDKYAPGLKIWALGHLFGLSAYHDEIRDFKNYLFIEYDPVKIKSLPEWAASKPFTAQIRLGYDYIESRSRLHVKPSFYWNFLDKLITVGVSFWYAQDFGNKLTEGSPYEFIEVEPKIQFNFDSSYIAFVYVWRSDYFHENLAYVDPLTAKQYEPIRQTQKINLRFCVRF